MIMPATLSLIRALFPDPRERALALGIWGGDGRRRRRDRAARRAARCSSSSAGTRRSCVNVPLMVVAVVAGWWLLPESRSDRPGRIDAAGVLLSVGGMAAPRVRRQASRQARRPSLVALVAPRRWAPRW